MKNSLFGAKLPTAIIRYPSGRFGIAGSIPVELTKESTHGTPQIPPDRVSLAWETEHEAIEALVSVGITRFQLADCSWHGDSK